MSTPAATVRDINEAEFAEAVIARSHEVLVLVDLWAEWCGPCRALGPILEAAVAARPGEVELVKLDIDANQAIAQQLQVRSIPAVKAFARGRLVDEFVGARDRAFVDQFIAALVPSAEERGLAHATALVAAGDVDGARAALEPLLQNAATHDRAQLLGARVAAMSGDVEGARACLAAIDEGSPEAAEAAALGTRLELDAAAASVGALDEALSKLEAEPDEHGLRYAVAGKLYGAGRVREALDQLLELVKRSRKFGDDAARRAMIAIFDAEAAHDDLVREFRRQLQIYL